MVIFFNVIIAVKDDEIELPTTAGKEVVDVTIAVEDEELELPKEKDQIDPPALSRI